MKKNQESVHVLAKGRVQGVGFRYFAQEKALLYGLKGWVRNLSGGPVEAEVEGPRVAIERFIEDLRQGPPMSRIDSLETHWKPPTSQFTTFEIR